MSTAFILFYIAAVIAALLALIGVVAIANGIINKNHKGATTGTILTGLAIIIIVSGLFWGARKCFRVVQRNCMHKEMDCKFKCMDMDTDHCKMPCDSMNMNGPEMNGDTCKMKMDKKCQMHGDQPCDPSKCQQKCPHEK